MQGSRHESHEKHISAQTVRIRGTSTFLTTIPGAATGARMARNWVKLKAGVNSAEFVVPVVKADSEFLAPPKDSTVSFASLHAARIRQMSSGGKQGQRKGLTNGSKRKRRRKEEQSG